MKISKKIILSLFAIGFIFSNSYSMKRSTTDSACEERSEADGKRKRTISFSPEHLRAVPINFIWVNKAVLDPDQEYIFPKDWIEKEKPFEAIFAWAKVSQGGSINLWYDSALNTQQAVENTRRLIEENAQTNPGLALISLRDVREIPILTEHPRVFSDEAPVYFRADLLRPVVALYLFAKDETDIFVYSDLDVKPMTVEELFDLETIKKLNKYGIVLCSSRDCGTCSWYENGFQIICGNKENLLEAMDYMLVQLNCGMFYHGRPNFLRQRLTEIVFKSYRLMFAYFYHLEGYGKLMVSPVGCDEEVEYDKVKHELSGFFDLRCFDNTYSFSGSWDIPTKKVRCTRSKCDYY